MTVADLMKEITRCGIESNLEGLIEKYNQNIEENRGDTPQNVAIRKIFGIGKSKSMQFDELVPLLTEAPKNVRQTEKKLARKNNSNN
jgi:hypothetical protein